MLSTASGVPISQPSLNFGIVGIAFGSPSGAPSLAQRISVSRSSSLRRQSLENVPLASTECHGGIVPTETRAAIDFAHGRTCS